MKPHRILEILLFVSLSNDAGIIFHPIKEDYKSNYSLDFQEWFIKSKSENKIRVRKYSTQDSSLGSILYFYGNGKNLTYRYSDYYWVTNHGYDLILFDYSGYGKSEGKPSLENSRDDAISTIEFIKKELQPGTLIFLGTSFGGAILISAYSRYMNKEGNDILILDSTFPSFRGIGSQYLKRSIIGWPISFLPVFFIKATDEPSYLIEKLEGAEILVTHCKDDKTIPIKNGRKLFKLIKGNKEFWELEKCSHSNGFKDEESKEKLLRYLKEKANRVNNQ